MQPSATDNHFQYVQALWVGIILPGWRLRAPQCVSGMSAKALSSCLLCTLLCCTIHAGGYSLWSRWGEIKAHCWRKRWKAIKSPSATSPSDAAQEKRADQPTKKLREGDYRQICGHYHRRAPRTQQLGRIRRPRCDSGSHMKAAISPWTAGELKFIG